MQHDISDDLTDLVSPEVAHQGLGIYRGTGLVRGKQDTL
jgi:hypothetical protein